MILRRAVLIIALAPLFVAAETSESPEALAPPEIDRRMLELEAREVALRVLEGDLRHKIDELTELREAATAAILPQERKKAEQLQTLISFYQAMKPKQAARLLESLSLPLAADVLASMKSRTAGKILNVMDRDRAVVISKRMAGRN